MIVWSGKLFVALRQEPEGVVVATEPKMEPMFLDSRRVFETAARRALAAAAPTELVKRHVVAIAELRCRREL
jgi:hypothetical protein